MLKRIGTSWFVPTQTATVVDTPWMYITGQEEGKKDNFPLIL